MFDRKAVFTVALAASLTVSLPVLAQDPGQLDRRTAGDAPERVSSTITGSVRTQDDHPIDDARVEIREISNGTVVASGYTSPSGPFEVYVPDGTYEVVATSGLSEARDRVRVDGIGGSVTLRLPHIIGATPRGGS